MNAELKLKAQAVKVERWFKPGINVSCVDRDRHRLVRPAVSSRLAHFVQQPQLAGLADVAGIILELADSIELEE